MFSQLDNPKWREPCSSPTHKVFFFFFNLVLLCCATRGILVPQPGVKPTPLASKTWNLNHWTVRLLFGGVRITSSVLYWGWRKWTWENWELDYWRRPLGLGSGGSGTCVSLPHGSWGSLAPSWSWQWEWVQWKLNIEYGNPLPKPPPNNPKLLCHAREGATWGK